MYYRPDVKTVVLRRRDISLNRTTIVIRQIEGTWHIRAEMIAVTPTENVVTVHVGEVAKLFPFLGVERGEMLTPGNGLLLQISLGQTSGVQCNAPARFAKFSPLRVLYQQERESFTWRDSAMRVIELSLEEDESLPLLAMRAPNNSASGEKELRRRRSNAPSADRSLTRSVGRCRDRYL